MGHLNKEVGEGTVKKVISIAIALLVSAIVLPTAFQTLADSGTTSVTTLIENDNGVHIGNVDNGTIVFDAVLDNADFSDNEMYHRADLEPQAKVDNYTYNLKLSKNASGSETVQYQTSSKNKTNDLSFENEITLDLSDADNIVATLVIENVWENGTDEVDENFAEENFFDVSNSRIETGTGTYSSTVHTLLIILLPILSVVAIIMLIFKGV